MKTVFALYAIVGTICFFLHMAGVEPLVAHTDGVAFKLMMFAPIALSALALAPAFRLIIEMFKKVNE